MKKQKIVAPGWIQDNAGNYHKAGAELTVDDDGGAGCISTAQAEQLAALDAQRQAQQAAKAAAEPAPAGETEAAAE